MDALGVALCYALAAILVSLCVAFVEMASKMQREESDQKQRQ